MNCKQGDLAVQIWGQNCGALVICLNVHNLGFGDWWDVKLLSRAKDIETGDILKPGSIAKTPDKELRPIRPNGVTDKEVTELYTPQEPVLERR